MALRYISRWARSESLAYVYFLNVRIAFTFCSFLCWVLVRRGFLSGTWRLWTCGRRRPQPPDGMCGADLKNLCLKFGLEVNLCA